MRAAWIILVVALGATSPSGQPAHLSKGAAALVRPVLSEYLAAHAEEFDATGRYLRESAHSAAFEKRLDERLGMHGGLADEAIAALMCFYIAEDPRAELR